MGVSHISETSKLLMISVGFSEKMFAPLGQGLFLYIIHMLFTASDNVAP